MKISKYQERKQKKSFKIPVDKEGRPAKIKTFSIDPQFRILKEIKSIKAPEDILITQLEHGETVFAKIQEFVLLRTNFQIALLKH